jgi:hypothetical protein
MPVIEIETTTNRIRTESADFQSSLSVQLELGVPSARSSESLAAGVFHSHESLSDDSPPVFPIRGPIQPAPERACGPRRWGSGWAGALLVVRTGRGRDRDTY